MKATITFIVALAVLSACSPADKQEISKQPQSTAAEAPPDLASVYQAAIKHSGRSQTDRDRDAKRKPAEVLEFFGIKPGMQVLDLFSGGGYYSEILSYIVGPEGHVTAHSNEAYAKYVGEEVIARYANDRLENVEILMAENNELQLDAERYDAVLMILAFHDIFWVDVKEGWPKIDGTALLAELWKAMKPGGVIGIVDHFAEAGSPRETGGTLHRIDPAIVIADMQAAGFILEDKSEILRNADDDYSKHMADPAVRSRTDRFVMRFVKPKQSSSL